jgi:glycine cleavage system H lipoate-binding protein
MTCPFLKEAQVRYCQPATVRKLIPLAQSAGADEKCSTADHISCPVFQAQQDGEPSIACPYLRTSLMQYCGAAPVAKFVPYSESLLSRCGNDSHRYCEVYLDMARPEANAIDGDIRVPEWLRYTANHMWLDVTGDGTCHAGIDAFLSRALGKVDAVSYVWTKGLHRAAAVLTIDGLELEVVFPNPFVLTKCNLYLRADPSRLTREPYTAGWLFEGTPSAETEEGLLSAAETRSWFEQEQLRMNQFLQQEAPHGSCGPVAADGGIFAAGVARALERNQTRAMFLEFFSPHANGK